MKTVNLIELGLCDYKKAWEIQKLLHQKRVEGRIEDTFIFVQHPHVYTLGKGGKEQNFKVNVEFLKQKGIPVHRIERGGDVTYHGPGQIVGYLIFNIKKRLAGIKNFVDKIEDAIIFMLKEYGIDGRKNENMIGVWVNDEKICALGIAVKRWVSFHGFALNVNTDLKYFDYIFPCGLNKGVTSLKQILGKDIDFDEVKNNLKKSFERVFEIEFKPENLDTILNK